MESLSDLERAVLDAIALQALAVGNALSQQQQPCVTARENTGAGFYTTFEVPDTLTGGVTSLVGDVEAMIAGLKHGMGFMLWLRDGRVDQLEGYSYEESTSGIDFEQVVFGPVQARC